ncbi:hypothetical protein H8356DRAFT_1352944 [Neocallimastix lanati (nom. inval.)]|nr:hypothetical protein H8356DRAFT_1352944 [Neocallimastix sp. JGI-2020a]
MPLFQMQLVEMQHFNNTPLVEMQPGEIGRQKEQKDLMLFDSVLGNIQMGCISSITETLNKNILNQNITSNNNIEIVIGNKINNIENNYDHSCCSETIFNNDENYSGRQEEQKDLMLFDSALGDIQLDSIFSASSSSSLQSQSPSLLSASSLPSSPLQSPPPTLSPSNNSVNNFQNCYSLNNYLLNNHCLNISKDYFEFKYKLLIKEKENLDIFLRK